MMPRIFVRSSGYPHAIIGGDACPDGYTERTAEEYRAIIAALPPEAPPAPAAPVPASVPASSFGKALIAAGILPSQVLAQIALIEDPAQLELAHWLFTRAATFERHDPTLVALASGLFRMADEEIDEHFRVAERL